MDSIHEGVHVPNYKIDASEYLPQVFWEFPEVFNNDNSEKEISEKPDSEEMQPEELRYQNSKLKTELEMSAAALNFQSEEINEWSVKTKLLTKKLRKESQKNEELKLKLAASRDVALMNTDEFLEIEFKLKKEIKKLKEQLNRKEEILEQMEATLASTLQDHKVSDQKVEDLNNLELELNQQQILALTSRNKQLEIELTDSKRTTEVMVKSRKLADELKVSNGLLQSNIIQLKKELTASVSQIDELKTEIAVQLYNASTWEATEAQLQHEIVDLKATLQTQNGTLTSKMSIQHDDNSSNLRFDSVQLMLAEKLSENNELTIRNSDLENDKSLLQANNETLSEELKGIKDENSHLNASLEALKESLAEKKTQYDELATHNLELEREKSLLKSLYNNDLREAEANRTELDRLKQSVILGVPKFLLVLSSKQKSTKLAEEQVEALEEALAALQEAVKHTKDAAKETKTERESISSHATKTEAEPKKRTLIRKLIAKRKTEKSQQQYEDGYANLLETTGLMMVERAKDLQNQATNIKAKGKALKMKAKTLK